VSDTVPYIKARLEIEAEANALRRNGRKTRAPGQSWAAAFRLEVYGSLSVATTGSHALPTSAWSSGLPPMRFIRRPVTNIKSPGSTNARKPGPPIVPRNINSSA